MQAKINIADFEIEWSSDDAITPNLVKQIENAGKQKNVDWLTSPFYEVIDLLLQKFDPLKLEEMLYDEDPEIIDLAFLTLRSPIDESNGDKMKEWIRLYFPVMIIVLKTVEDDRLRR